MCWAAWLLSPSGCSHCQSRSSWMSLPIARPSLMSNRSDRIYTAPRVILANVLGSLALVAIRMLALPVEELLDEPANRPSLFDVQQVRSDLYCPSRDTR